MGDGPPASQTPRAGGNFPAFMPLSASPLQVLAPPPILREVTQPCGQWHLTPSPPAPPHPQDLAGLGHRESHLLSLFQARQHPLLGQDESRNTDQAGKVMWEAGTSITEGGSCSRSKPALSASTSSLAEGRGRGRLEARVGAELQERSLDSQTIADTQRYLWQRGEVGELQWPLSPGCGGAKGRAPCPRHLPGKASWRRKHPSWVLRRHC